MAENESLLDRQVSPDAPKTNRRKLKIIFIAFIIVGFGALVGNGLYNYYKAANSLKDYEKDYNARIEAERAAKMADTYGGKTPAETLQLYIDAVKKGDYELASKYLIEKYRQVDLDSFGATTQQKIISFIKELEVSLENIDRGKGSYSPAKDGFTIDSPILIDFTLYPNGIWKLTEL